jgi:hypothetical protein
MDQKAKCRKCGNFFPKEEILVTFDGFYCSEDLPEGTSKKFFTISLSWQGINALVDYLEGDANVDQLMIIDKIKEKLALRILEAIREMVERGGEVQKPDS